MQPDSAAPPPDAAIRAKLGGLPNFAWKNFLFSHLKSSAQLPILVLVEFWEYGALGTAGPAALDREVF